MLQHGASVRWVATVEDALSTMRGSTPDLLVVDLGSGSATDDGFEVVDAMRSSTRLCAVPTVVHAGRILDDSEREHVRLDRTWFITKGIALCDFVQQIVAILRNVKRTLANH